jgi:hypothetical protein
MKLGRDMAGGEVEDEKDGGCMLERFSKITANPGVVVPFQLRFAGLQRRGKNQGGAAEGI